MRLTRILLWALLATIIATIFIPLISMQLPRWGLIAPRPDIALLYGVLTLAYLIVALGCAVALENGRSPRLMRNGILVGAIALAGWFVLLALQPPWPFVLSVQRVLIWPTCWAGLMMVIGLMLMPKPHARWWMMLRRTAIVLVASFAAFICVAVTFYPLPRYEQGIMYSAAYKYEDACERIGGVLMLLAGGAVLVTFLGAWLPRFSGSAPVDVQRWNYWLRCPRCQHEQDAQTGVHSCTNCGLRIRVEVT